MLCWLTQLSEHCCQQPNSSRADNPHSRQAGAGQGSVTNSLEGTCSSPRIGTCQALGEVCLPHPRLYCTHSRTHTPINSSPVCKKGGKEACNYEFTEQKVPGLFLHLLLDTEMRHSYASQTLYHPHLGMVKLLRPERGAPTENNNV